MFGGANQEMFMRMVLGLDQQQVLTLLNGFVYHTFFLDAFSGSVPSLMVLHNVILAFGLIGFTLLALQRSLWTPSVIISWIVLVGLLILGSRGADVLFTPLNKGGIDAAVKGSAFQDTVTTYDNAMDTVRWIENGREADSSASPGVAFPTTGAMMSKSLESAQALAQGQGSGAYKITDVGAFTPMVFVLYTFNTMKKELLNGMSNRINVDILNRTGIANRIGAGKLYPSTQFLLRTFIDECSSGDLSEAMLGGGHINNAPESVGKIPLETGETIEQVLTGREFTFRNLVNMQRNYFDDIKTTSYMKSFVGMPVGRATLTLADAKNLITIPPAAIWGNLSWGAGKSEKVLESYLAGQRQGDDSYYQNMRDNITRSDLSLDAPGLKRKSVIYASIYKMSAGKPGTSTSSGSGIDKTSVSFANCWELYKEYYANLNENFGGSEIEKRLGKLAFESEAQGMKPTNGVLILNPAAKKDTDYDVALSALEKKCAAACNYAGGNNVKKCPACNFVTGICKPELSSMSAMGVIGTAVGTAMQASTCIAAQKDYVWTVELVRGGAVDVELGKIAAADEYFRDPKKMSSGVRDFTADMGKYLGPVAMWFFALFGGFAAGAYSAIVPSFMNFTLMMIFALTPFMFMMGVLMPAWAPQIILTPIVGVAYLKIVEVMFILVGFVFAALRIGLENSGLITPPSWLMIFKGVDTFNAMYDIMIGMAYTSMFAIAGFMMVGVRNPASLVGGLASAGDKFGNVSGTEVFKIAAAAGAAGAVVKKAGGLAMKGFDAGQNVKFVTGQIREKGLGKGLKDSATALTGSLSERGQKRQLALQGRLDGVEGTAADYREMQRKRNLDATSSGLGINIVNQQQADDAQGVLISDRKETARSKAALEDGLRGAGFGDYVDQARTKRQIKGADYVSGDTAAEALRSRLTNGLLEELKTQNNLTPGQVGNLKPKVQMDVDKLLMVFAAQSRGQKDVIKDDIDFTAKTNEVTIDPTNSPAFQEFEKNYGNTMRTATDSSGNLLFSAFNAQQVKFKYGLDKDQTRQPGAAGPGTGPNNPGGTAGGPGGGNPGPGTAAGNPGAGAPGNPGAAAGGPGGGNPGPGTAAGNPGAAAGNPGGGNAGPGAAAGGFGGFGSGFGGGASAGSTPNGGMRSPGGIILSGNIASALQARNQAQANAQAQLAQRASTAAAVASGQAIANSIATTLNQALSGLQAPAPKAPQAAPPPSIPTSVSRSAPVIQNQAPAPTQSKTLSEAERQNLTDPSNIGDVVRDMQSRMEELQNDATKIKGDVSDIKNKPKN